MIASLFSPHRAIQKAFSPDSSVRLRQFDATSGVPLIWRTSRISSITVKQEYGSGYYHQRCRDGQEGLVAFQSWQRQVDNRLTSASIRNALGDGSKALFDALPGRQACPYSGGSIMKRQAIWIPALFAVLLALCGIYQNVWARPTQAAVIRTYYVYDEEYRISVVLRLKLLENGISEVYGALTDSEKTPPLSTRLRGASIQRPENSQAKLMIPQLASQGLLQTEVGV